MVKLLIKVIFPLLIMLPAGVEALECGEEVNFYHKERQGDQEALPIVNQKKAGICYAITAATGIDVLRKNRDILEFNHNGPIDPIWVAFNYFRAKDLRAKNFDGGKVRESTYEVANKKNCNNEEFKRIITPYLKDASVFAGKNNNFLFDFYLLTTKMMKKIGDREMAMLRTLEEDPAKIEEQIRKFIKKISWEKFSMGCFPLFSRKDSILRDFDLFKIYKRMLPYFPRKDYLGFFGEVINCDSITDNNNIRVDVLTEQINIDSRNRDPNYLPGIINKLVSELEKNNPIGVTYSADIFDYTFFIGKTLPHRRTDTIKSGHASILVGKRTERGECQFLLKNSWGEKMCATGWACHKDSQKRSRAEWINAKEFLKWTYGITIFSLPKKIVPESLENLMEAMENLEKYDLDAIFSKTKSSVPPKDVPLGSFDDL